MISRAAQAAVVEENRKLFTQLLVPSPMHLSSLLYISHTVDSYGHVCRQQMHSHKKLKENIAEHFLSLALLLS